MTDSASTAAAAAATTEARPTSDASDDGANPTYAERLYLPWYHWLLPLLAAGLLAAEVHMGYPGVRSWLPYVIVIPLTLLLCWRFGAAKVVVSGGEVHAGEAHLPVRFIDEIRIVPATAKRKVLGPAFDPAAFALHRSWIGPMVWLKLNDPDDPTPYWLVSSRHPEELVNALTASITEQDALGEAGEVRDAAPAESAPAREESTSAAISEKISESAEQGE